MCFAEATAAGAAVAVNRFFHRSGSSFSTNDCVCFFFRFVIYLSPTLSLSFLCVLFVLSHNRIALSRYYDYHFAFIRDAVVVVTVIVVVASILK